MYHLPLNKINFYVEHKDSQYIFGMVQASLNLKFMWKTSPQLQEGQWVNKYHRIQKGRELRDSVHQPPSLDMWTQGPKPSNSLDGSIVHIQNFQQSPWKNCHHSEVCKGKPMSNVWLPANSARVSIMAFYPNPADFTHRKINNVSLVLTPLPVGISHFIAMNSLADGPDCPLILWWKIRTKVPDMSSEE